MSDSGQQLPERGYSFQNGFDHVGVADDGAQCSMGSRLACLPAGDAVLDRKAAGRPKSDDAVLFPQRQPLDNCKRLPTAVYL